MIDIKYPEVTVDLTRIDGNAFSILGAVAAAMKSAGVSKEERDAYRAEATAGDYNHLLLTTMRWVETAPEDEDEDYEEEYYDDEEAEWDDFYIPSHMEYESL